MSMASPYQLSAWPLAPVGSMVDLANGYPFNSDDFGDVGMPLVRIRDLTATEFSTFVPEPVPSHVILQDGDVVIGMDGDFTVHRWNRGPAALNQRLCRLRERTNADLRFVAYALPLPLQVINDTQYATTVKHLSSGEIMSARIPAPPLEEQRRIADFLDDQITRIDALVRLKLAQRELFEEQLSSELEDIFRAPSSRPLKTVVDPKRPIQYGIVLPGPHFPGGVPIIKGGDVTAKRLRLDALNRTDPSIEAGYARSRLVPGDLVISIRGSVGEVEVVPDELLGANLTQDAARIAPQGVDTEWLRLALGTPSVQRDLRGRVTGAMVTGINIESLKMVAVPDVTHQEQRRQSESGQHAERIAQTMRDSAQASVALLQEYKRSLITAAVTGELDVATARRGVPA